jgi:hypothetical protein
VCERERERKRGERECGCVSLGWSDGWKEDKRLYLKNQIIYDLSIINTFFYEFQKSMLKPSNKNIF